MVSIFCISFCFLIFNPPPFGGGDGWFTFGECAFSESSGHLKAKKIIFLLTSRFSPWEGHMGAEAYSRLAAHLCIADVEAAALDPSEGEATGADGGQGPVICGKLP
jgi:hypothetical protein